MVAEKQPQRSVVRHPVATLLDFLRETHEGLIDRNVRLDWRPIVVFFTAAVSLSFQEFWGDRDTFRAVAGVTEEMLQLQRWTELWYFVWWSGWRVLGFLIVPSIVVLCMPGERLRDYGWSPRGFFKHLKLYLLLYVLVLPFVVAMSTTRSFRHIYPFYKHAGWSTFDLVSWELMYAAQFLSLEFFFRGFMLFALRRSLGIYAVFAMIVPYNMIHYGKTLPESLGAIVAGMVLGVIALRTRSIWGGIFVHVAVAVTMDLLTVGYLPHP